MHASSAVTEVDAATLARMLAEPGGGLVLVDFFAEHCVWCERVEPVIAAVAPDFAGRVRFVKIDAGRFPEALPAGGIRGTPTLAVYRDGRFLTSKTGMIQKGALDAFLTYWLDPANDA